MGQWGMRAAFVAVALLALTGCGTGAATGGEAQAVQVTARDFRWTLGRTVFQPGRPIQFDIRSVDGVHGFSIDNTTVSRQISPGQEEKVLWTPPGPGTYTVRCNFYCGSGHDQMYTQFTVQ